MALNSNSVGQVSRAASLLPNPEVVRKELAVAYSVLGNEEMAMFAVAKALAQQPVFAKSQKGNRKPRAKQRERRASYRSLIGYPETLRLRVLVELDDAEVALEKAGYLMTPEQQLLCYVKQIAKRTLMHNSFYAAIGMGQVLCRYTSQEVIRLYDDVTRSTLRTLKKDPKACTRAKERFFLTFIDRFENRVDLHTNGPAHELKSHHANPAEAAIVKHGLELFLPQAAAATSPPSLLKRWWGQKQDDSVVEADNVRKFLLPHEFNKLAQSMKLKPRGPMEQHLWIPDIRCPSTPPRAPEEFLEGDSMPDFDLDKLATLVAEEQHRISLVSPDTLRIVVDNVDRGPVPAGATRSAMILEDSAGVVRLRGHGEDGELVTVATYILTRDEEGESCEFALPNGEKLMATFECNDDDTVRAVFALVAPPSAPLAESVSEGLNGSWRILVLGQAGAGKTSFLSAMYALLADRPLKKTEEDVKVLLDTSSSARTIRESESGTGGRKMISTQSSHMMDLVTSHREALVGFFRATVCKAVEAEDLFLDVCLKAMGLRDRWPDAPDEKRWLFGIARSVRAEHLRRRSGEAEWARIDRLVSTQHEVFSEFIEEAQRRALEIEPAPRVVIDEVSRGRSLGMLSIILLLADVIVASLVGRIFFATHLLALIPVALTLALSGVLCREWWKSRWSVRLFNRYHASRLAIEALRGDLNSDGNVDNPDVPTADWRWVPLSKKLRWMIKDGKTAGSPCSLANNASPEELAGVCMNARDIQLESAQSIARAIVLARPIRSDRQLLEVIREGLVQSID
ncbi:MAG: sigma-70 family RNA polymerase sigma factor [Pseudomonadota bacterium]